MSVILRVPITPLFVYPYHILKLFRDFLPFKMDHETKYIFLPNIIVNYDTQLHNEICAHDLAEKNTIFILLNASNCPCVYFRQHRILTLYSTRTEPLGYIIIAMNILRIIGKISIVDFAVKYITELMFKCSLIYFSNPIPP